MPALRPRSVAQLAAANAPVPDSRPLRTALAARPAAPTRAREDWSWLERYLDTTLPDPRPGAVAAGPLAIGNLVVNARAGWSAVATMIEPGLYLVGEVPDYEADPRRPRGDNWIVDLATGIGDAATGITAGLGNFIMGSVANVHQQQNDKALAELNRDAYARLLKMDDEELLENRALAERFGFTFEDEPEPEAPRRERLPREERKVQVRLVSAEATPVVRVVSADAPRPSDARPTSVDHLPRGLPAALGLPAAVGRPCCSRCALGRSCEGA